MFSGEAAYINFIVFGLYRRWFKLTISHTRWVHQPLYHQCCRLFSLESISH